MIALNLAIYIDNYSEDPNRTSFIKINLISKLNYKYLYG